MIKMKVALLDTQALGMIGQERARKHMVHVDALLA